MARRSGGGLQQVVAGHFRDLQIQVIAELSQPVERKREFLPGHFLSGGRLQRKRQLAVRRLRIVVDHHQQEAVGGIRAQRRLRP
jgi:hypothetical protein